MGWFDAFRDGGSNTYYGDKRNAVVFDTNIVAIVFFTIVIATALIVFVIGSRGRERWTTFLRFILSMHTGVIILVCIHGTGWQSGHIQSHCGYTATYQEEVKATIGVLVGLKYVNITLTGYMNVSEYSGYIDYNERFSFNKVYQIEMEFRQSLTKGLPWPIVSALEYIAIDKGDLQWMRSLHESGHFSYILSWCAFVSWIGSNILIGFVVARGAVLWTMTGVLMIVSQVLYDTLQPITALQIPFKDGFLTFHYDWCFWLQILSGVVTFLTGIAILVFHHVYSEQSNLLFLVDRSHSTLNNTHDQDTRFIGPLQITTPSTQRKLRMPYSYSNPAFSNCLKDVDGCDEKANLPRKQSFDFGHLTTMKTGSLRVQKSRPMTSIFESSVSSKKSGNKDTRDSDDSIQHIGESPTAATPYSPTYSEPFPLEKGRTGQRIKQQDENQRGTKETFPENPCGTKHTFSENSGGTKQTLCKNSGGTKQTFSENPGGTKQTFSEIAGGTKQTLSENPGRTKQTSENPGGTKQTFSENPGGTKQTSSENPGRTKQTSENPDGTQPSSVEENVSQSCSEFSKSLTELHQTESKDTEDCPSLHKSRSAIMITISEDS